MNRPSPILRSAVLRGRGHPAIRATHAKTLELTADTAITERATCVVGVGARFDPDGSLADLAALRGRVRLRLATPGLPEAVGEAVINPGHAVADRLVIRRRGAAGTDSEAAETLAVDSTLTARDLSPEFAAALADPGREVTLTVEELGPERPLVLVGTIGRGAPVRLDPHRRGQWLRAEAFIDLTGGLPILSTAKLAKLSADALAVVADGGVAAVALPCLTVPPPPPGEDFLRGAAKLGARFCVVPRGEGAESLLEALLAAGLPPAPYAWLGSPQRLSALPATPVVFRMPEAVPPSVFADRAVWTEDPAGPDLGTAVRQVPAEEAVAAVGALTVVGAALGEVADPVDLHAVARALADAGIAPRTLTEALADFGLTRKKLYSLLKDDE